MAINQRSIEIIEGTGRPAPKPQGPKKKGKHAATAYRSGSQAAPYQRARDNVHMVKIGFSCTASFAVELKRFAGELPASTSRSEWLEAAILDRIEHHRRRVAAEIEAAASQQSRDDALEHQRDNALTLRRNPALPR